MLVDEVPHSFMKKNYNYSHCPLKKRPFYYTSEDEEEVPEAIKGLAIFFLLSHNSFEIHFYMKFNVYIIRLFLFLSIQFIYVLCILFLILFILSIKINR